MAGFWDEMNTGAFWAPVSVRRIIDGEIRGRLARLQQRRCDHPPAHGDRSGREPDDGRSSHADCCLVPAFP